MPFCIRRPLKGHFNIKFCQNIFSTNKDLQMYSTIEDIQQISAPIDICSSLQKNFLKYTPRFT